MKPTTEQIEHRAIQLLRELIVHLCEGEREVELEFLVDEALLKAEKELSKPQLSDDEKVILRNLPKEYKWIVRDKYNDIYLHNDRPKKYEDGWGSCYTVEELDLFDHLFQFITWEDDEPYNIEELLNG